MVANFWRATQHDPEAVATYADGHVSEVDLHARHRYLMLSEDAATFRERMRTDPDYFDARMAGWWCWGLACWIGSGWCSTPAEIQRNAGSTPALQGSNGKGQGVCWTLPNLSGDAGAAGRGVHASASPKSKVRIAGHNPGSAGKGVCAQGSAEWLQRPVLEERRLHAKRPRCDSEGGRGLLGVLHGEGTCAERRAWLLDWFGRLRDRLRNVRVCCGGWLRVCDSPSVTTRLGLTGIFFDPPYSKAAKRAKGLYASDSEAVADDVRRYCLERGNDPLVRLALAGYEGEGHEVLEKHGWTVESWTSNGGYGNRKGNQNRKKERLWFSPHCCRERTLFSEDTSDV